MDGLAHNACAAYRAISVFRRLCGICEGPNQVRRAKLLLRAGSQFVYTSHLSMANNTAPLPPPPPGASSPGYISAQLAQSGSMRGDSICAFCSRMKRGVLYSCCREKGYNKLVLGQHLDDMAESFFMSAFRNGKVCAYTHQHAGFPFCMWRGWVEWWW